MSENKDEIPQVPVAISTSDHKLAALFFDKISQCIRGWKFKNHFRIPLEAAFSDEINHPDLAIFMTCRQLLWGKWLSRSSAKLKTLPEQIHEAGHCTASGDIEGFRLILI